MARAVIIAATIAILSVMYLERPKPVEANSARYCFVSDPFDPRDFVLCSELKYKVWI